MINFCNVAFVAAYAIGGTMDAGCKNTDKKSFSAIIRRIFFLRAAEAAARYLLFFYTPPLS
ncbi:hypothetical protein [Bacteroides zoogleoformans]|uniref:hypothetical protein n=1 Tax=Bacteroides zoogleoformans TaxID=28119 RepID=UPI00248E659A|nr:hypothetical protein [Bacteroides zoogleoformans]